MSNRPRRNRPDGRGSGRPGHGGDAALRDPRPAFRDTRLGAVSRRLFSAARLTVVAVVAAVFAPLGGTAAGDNAAPGGSTPATAGFGLIGQAGPAPATPPATAPAAAAASPSAGIPPAVADALKALKNPSPSEREKQYEVLNEKGDARIIPALRAFLGGQLQLRDDKLILYGKAEETKGDGGIIRMFPVYDALTNEQVISPDGLPLVEKINLSKAFRAPLTASQKERVLDLIATLSLLHPDPEVRLASIRDASERASRAFPDPDDEKQIQAALKAYADQAKTSAVGTATPATTQPAMAAASPAEQELLAAIDVALAAKATALLSPLPPEEAVGKVSDALAKAVEVDKLKGSDPTTLPVADRASAGAKTRLADAIGKYKDRLATLKKNTEDLGKFAAAFDRQLKAEPAGPFAKVLGESKAMTDAVLKDKPEQKGERAAAIKLLGDLGTSRAANVLRKLYDAATRSGDAELAKEVSPSLSAAESYQTKVRLVQYTFAGLSTGSIYVLLALGLAIIFGLMGVINMAHGEFMMVGAFTTYAVAQWFRTAFPGGYDYFPIVAVPAAFAAAGVIGLLTEYLVIRHLYGRTTDTLIATIGVGLVLVWLARYFFGDNLAYNSPRWMQGSMEVAPDLLLNRARFWTIVYCGLCVTVVYLIVNKTKLGLLLRATTQNRKMAAALGVPTRLVDAMTFGFGAGLAGMAGVVVPMIDKINPGMGQDYVVSSFMVVVVGGVGKLAGAIIAGFGLGAIGNYLEPFLGSFAAFAKTSSVLSKVLVLTAVVLFLQWRPSGLFPPKGRVADA